MGNGNREDVRTYPNALGGGLIWVNDWRADRCRNSFQNGHSSGGGNLIEGDGRTLDFSGSKVA